MGNPKSSSTIYFAIELDGILTTRFQKCSGLEVETEVFSYEEGGYGIRNFPSHTRFSNLILEKGINDNNELFNWYKQNIIERKIERKNGSIVLYNSNEEVKRWNFFRALPVRWIGPKLEAKFNNSLLVEKIEIAYESLELDNSSENCWFHIGEDLSNQTIFTNTMKGNITEEKSNKIILNELAEISNGIATPIGKTWNDAQNVTSVWGEREVFELSNGKITNSGHNGMDFAAPKGTRINAIKNGIVTKIENNPNNSRGYGKYIELTHEDGTHSLYAHQSKITVNVGEEVHAGQKIGEVGSTGNVIGSHLHLGYDGNKDGHYDKSNKFDNPAKILYSDGD